METQLDDNNGTRMSLVTLLLSDYGPFTYGLWHRVHKKLSLKTIFHRDLTTGKIDSRDKGWRAHFSVAK